MPWLTRVFSALSDRVVNAGIWCEAAFFASMSSFRAWRARRRAHPRPQQTQPRPVPAQTAPAQQPVVPGGNVVAFPQNGRAGGDTIRIEGTPEQLRDFINGLTAVGGQGATAPGAGASPTTPAGGGQPPAEGWWAVLAALGRWLRNLLGWLLRHPALFATLIAAALVWFWLVPWVKGFFTLAPPGPIGGPPSVSSPGSTSPPVQPPAGGGLAPAAPLTPPSGGGLAPPAPIGGGTPPASQPAQPPAAAGGGLQAPAPIDPPKDGGLNPPAPIGDGAKKGGEIKPPAAVEGGKPPPSPPAEKAQVIERTLPDGRLERILPDGTIERYSRPSK